MDRCFQITIFLLMPSVSDFTYIDGLKKCQFILLIMQKLFKKSRSMHTQTHSIGFLTLFKPFGPIKFFFNSISIYQGYHHALGHLDLKLFK